MEPPPGTPESGPSVRERRAERARSRRWRELSPSARRRTALLVALALAAVAIYAAVEYIPTKERVRGPKSIHKHAALKVFVDGEELRLDHCEFDLEGCGRVDGNHYVPAHMHVDDWQLHGLRYVLHIEHPPQLGNLTVGRFFQRHGFNFTGDQLTLDTRVYDGEAIANNATHAWRVWASHCFVDPPVWEPVEDAANYVPLEHDRLLVSFTDRGVAELQDQWADIPTSIEMHDISAGNCPSIVGTTTSSPAT